jgi:hypothetical protein
MVAVVLRIAKCAKRIRAIQIALLILMLTLSAFVPGTAQSLESQDNFDQACRTGWPNWMEVGKPACGSQPRVINGLGFLFVNGCNLDPLLNSEHLLFSQPLSSQAVVSEATGRFKFSNAANGGKLLGRSGEYWCLGNTDVMNFATNELLIVTLLDDGNSWYGAFIGDYGTLIPEHVPSPDVSDPRSYSVIGLLRKSVDGLQTLAISIIPSVRRFVAINCTVKVQTSSSTDRLEATFAIQNCGTYTVKTDADPLLAPTGTQSGIIYLAGGGFPCTNLPQREVAVDSFQIRF